MRFYAILILSVISILNSLELKSRTVIKTLNNGYKVERSLFLNEKKIEVYNKQGRLVKLFTDEIKCQKIFLYQSSSLFGYGIILKYPEVMYKNVCIIADVLSSCDPSEVLSFTKPIRKRKKIFIQDINKYYTYLDTSIDYVVSVSIVVKDSLTTQYSCIYKSNMSDIIIPYTCIFTYDKNNRIIELEKIYSQHYETKGIMYENK